MGLGERVRAAAEPHVGDERVPGLVALVAHGDDVYVEALGTLAIGGAPIRRDSLFRIASTTKPITAAVTLAVIEEGLIGLDEPVDRLLPELGGRSVLDAVVRAARDARHGVLDGRDRPPRHRLRRAAGGARGLG
jgi:CubicO group peptidase (beta-lactamase class C family)